MQKEERKEEEEKSTVATESSLHPLACLDPNLPKQKGPPAADSSNLDSSFQSSSSASSSFSFAAMPECWDGVSAIGLSV